MPKNIRDSQSERVSHHWRSRVHFFCWLQTYLIVLQVEQFECCAPAEVVLYMRCDNNIAILASCYGGIALVCFFRTLKERDCADFLLTLEIDGKRVYHARTIKKAQDLASKRVIKKVEIEHRYWQAHGIDWGIVTERDIPTTVITKS